MAGAPNDVGYKNNTHSSGISIYYFPKDVAVCLKWTRFDRRHRGDFLFYILPLVVSIVFQKQVYISVNIIKSYMCTALEEMNIEAFLAVMNTS